MTHYRNPVHDGYFADPFVLHLPDDVPGPRYVAFGTGRRVGALVFEVLVSDDLIHWRSAGGALEPLPPEAGTDYWAPEVAHADGRWWMYYSVGHEDTGHHLRVAVADSPTGPYRDCGVELAPAERFAIDPHPFQDVDGTWYLFYARDVLEGERVGTMLAVDILDGMTSLRGAPHSVLTPSGDWQIFLRGRSMYGSTYDWHTLEGPCVLHRDDRYVLLYSGGNWQESSYGVGYAVADHPLGPWKEPQPGSRLLSTVPGRVVGPGHNSVVTTADGLDVAVYHAWDPGCTARRLFIDPLWWTPSGPVVDGPTWQPTDLRRSPG